MKEFLLICAAVFVGLCACFGFEEWARRHPSAWRKYFAAGLLSTYTRRKGTR